MAKGQVSTQELKHDPLIDKYFETTSWLKKNSRQVLYGVIGIAVILVAFFGYRAYSHSRTEKAADALAEAFRIDQAPVANPKPAGVDLAFTSADEKAKAAYEAFSKVARDYPSQYGDLANYMAAIRQLSFDATKAEATLRELSNKNSSVSAQARLALAERYEATNHVKEAIDELQKLKANPGDVAMTTIDLNLAEAYEAIGDKQKASDIYFDLASQFQGKQSSIGTRALTRLAILDPTRVDNLPDPSKSGSSPAQAPEVIRN